MSRTTIEAVRVSEADGSPVELAWHPGTWYLIRDDHPYLDILTRGHPARSVGDAKIQLLPEPCEEGMQWQRWDLSELMSRHRTLGEVRAPLRVPRDCTLRCYVIPTALLSHRDVLAMAEDVEAELGFPAFWDILAERRDRAWSRPSGGRLRRPPAELIALVDEEAGAAASVRRSPFSELEPRSRQSLPLSENALVSHWAARRSGQLRDLVADLSEALEATEARCARTNPEMRQQRLEAELAQLRVLLPGVEDLAARLTGLIREVELGTPIHPSSLLQRDHRLRLLLRAFAPATSEAISEDESARSHYPPLFLNQLWELWGAVWLAGELRRLGFAGSCSVESSDTITRCSWRLTRAAITVELDFEAEPVLVDYDRMPPVHERAMPALEWAGRNQQLDLERPFLGVEQKCSPDYLLRITGPAGRALIVGDACLASASHHGLNKLDSKPYMVERYRRTLGWADSGEIIRCHPLGGFVLFPPPAGAWSGLESIAGASDCMLLCPSPQGDTEASRRLELLLRSVAGEVVVLPQEDPGGAGGG